MILDGCIKARLILFKGCASFEDNLVHLFTRVAAIRLLVSVNPQWSAQARIPSVRLHEKENDVTEEKQLQRLQERLTSTGEVLRCEQAGRGYQATKASKKA